MPFTKETRAKAPTRGQGKLNRTVKETVLAVFNELQEDPKNSLKTFAKKFPRDFYNISAKLIPNEVAGTINSKISLTIVRGKPGTQ